MDLDAAHILSQDCKFCLFNTADNRYQRRKKKQKNNKVIIIPSPISYWRISSLWLLQTQRNSRLTGCQIFSLATGLPKAVPFTFFLSCKTAPSCALTFGFCPAWEKQPSPHANLKSI